MVSTRSSMRTHRLMLVTLLSLCALAATLLLSSAAAQAAITHHFLYKITEVPATGPKGEPVSLPGPIGAPADLTVDSGKLWTSEFVPGAGSWRVDAFNAATGAFAAQLSPNQEEGLSYLQEGVAVGHSTGETELYVGADANVEGSTQGAIGVFNAAGERQATWTGADTPSGHFGCFDCSLPGDVAVDRSANVLEDWAAGDVYVSSPQGRVVDVFAPEAGGGEKYVTQITGTSPSEPFTAEPGGVAVAEANGAVLVLVGGGIDVFKPTVLGAYEFVRRIAGTPNGPFPRNPHAQLAVGGGEDDGDIYYSTGYEFGEGHGEVDQFSSEGVFLGRVLGASPGEPFTSVPAVAVDPESHDVYAATSGAIDVFGPGLVVPDAATAPPSAVKGTGQGQIELTLNGTVNPDGAGPATCTFEFGTSEALGEQVPCAAPVADGSSPAPVSAAVGGLLPDTTYYYRLAASNTNGTSESQIAQLRTPGPGLRIEAVSAVRAESAKFEAKLDPNGAPTTYYFQYGTSTAYGADAPALNGGAGAPAGAGEGDVEVSQHVQGLLAVTVYHYRLVAVSELAPGEAEIFFGPDQTFTTQPAGAPFQLPDGRAWEMVSPPQKEGALFGPIAEGTRASANGDALADTTFFQPVELEQPGSDNHDEVFFGRGPGGWVSKVITPPHERATQLSVGGGGEYRMFSDDLSKAVMQPFGGFTPLSPQATETTAYLHSDYLNGDPGQICTTDCYQPLVTAANVPPGTRFGQQAPNGECGVHGFLFICGPTYLGGTPNLDHLLLDTPVALTDTALEGASGLYEWSAGKLELVNILPAGETNEHGGPIASPEPRFAGTVPHTLSEDGSRVLWLGTPHANVWHLYLRDMGAGETVRLDLPQAGATGSGEEEPQFMGASSDGSRIFFLDRDLTADSTPGFSLDLYEYDLNAPLGSRLTDLTVDPNKGEVAEVSRVVGASSDGSYVYFAAGGALAPGASPGSCGQVSATKLCNMYVSHDGRTTFVAGLAVDDVADWWSRLEGLTASVSPNGRWLAFMSSRDLAGYDTTDAVSRRPDEEVYLYDAAHDTLACASCDPTGARPVGEEVGESTGSLAFNEGAIKPSTWAASSIPMGWTRIELATVVYQARYLSNSGRLFFNSHDALSPQDVNGTEDAYEYEPPGVGGCGTSSVTYSPRSAGCVGLVSSGTSNQQSVFLEASATGGDVFFLTVSQLVPQDFDNEFDIYDAHECTAASPCIAPAPAALPPCDNADSCKPAQSLQPTAFGAGPSETFSGAGNVAPSAPAVRPRGLTRAQKLARALRSCAQVRARGRRAACERRARRRYGGAAAGKAARGARRARRERPGGARR